MLWLTVANCGLLWQLELKKSVVGLQHSDLPLDAAHQIPKPGWALGEAGKDAFSKRLSSIMMPCGCTAPTDPNKYFGLKVHT